MSDQSPSVRLRGQDFPSGLGTSDAVEKLGQILNPVLRSLSVLGANGVNINSNFDGLISSFTVTTPTSDWAAFTPVTWANSGAPYPVFGWRRDAGGNTWTRGRIASLPALNTTLATLPAFSAPVATVRVPVDAAGAYGAIEIASSGAIKQVAGSVAGTLDLNVGFPSVGAAPGVFSCWPQQIRIDTGRRPAAIILLQAIDVTQSPTTTPPISAGPIQWSYVGANPGKPNLASIDDVPGLALSRSYVLTVLVLFQ